MKKPILMMAAAAFLLAPHCSHAQARLVEKVVQQGNETVIPFERYVLPNGLTLLIHEDHSDPIVHVDVTYHVGSAREEIGKSGFAHFFEHMMFQGSDNVADEQHFKVITEAGGTLNGTTNKDRTNYFETVPANQLEKMLWLESDRMGFLIDAVTQQKFEVQRATVKNERGQRYDNVPYGLVSEVASKNLYPYGHPYSWLTIGYIEDLNRVNAQDLKNFFLRWYSPNNAVLTIGGDVNPKEVVAMVEKYFGPIPKGPEVKPVVLPIPTVASNRYISMVDNYAKNPMLRIIYPAAPRFHKDEPAMDCLAAIIGDGKTSLLYKNLVKTQKAVNASSYNATYELAGEFTINVTPFPGVKLSEINDIVNATLLEFEKRGVTDDDIEKFKSQQEANTIYGLESVAGKVSELASFFTFTGDANYIGKYLKSYNSVTKEDVMNVYKKYIKGHATEIISVLTKNDSTNIVDKENYIVSTDGYKAPDYGYNQLKYNKAKDNFDRSKMPEAGSAVVVKAPEYWENNIENNIKVIGAQTNEIPVVNILLSFKGGSMVDADGKEGTAKLFAAMMNEDTKNYSSEDFNAALDRLGSSITISEDNDAIRVQVRCLSKNIEKTMDLLEEKLLRPNFTKEDFERVQKRNIQNLKNAMNQPAYVANIVFNNVLFGKKNPLGRTANETTLSHITLDDINDYYQNKFTKINAEAVVVGDVESKEIMKKLSFLAQLPNTEVMLPVLPDAPNRERLLVYFVDVPGAAQTEFRVGTVTNLKYDALGDFYKSTVMNYPLGGAFNSRLNLYLREDKGWTYGARSVFDGDQYSGDFTFSGGIKAAATDSALSDVIRIIEAYKSKGITAEELSFTKNSITQSEARKYETGFQKASFLNRILTYDLPKDYSVKQQALLNTFTQKDINETAMKYIPSAAKTVVVLVGDKSMLKDKIKSKGFEIVELDKDGNILN
ncbi:insulinase family protein [Taibaiella lutea]|uniref:Insulinase family protein n=1 Tax=Taibaiella lutea TaxID=2608001 RepID=A0A5M6CQF9_9BACT|nr:pitrilysin family protein [Taibaiella lutea]KAA5536620.1 insulinase family protein [Taibaiella lutea]